MTEEKMFVYGALRRGASNHWRMKEAAFVSEATLQGVLVKIDWYPGLVPDPESSEKVVGEVYEVDEALIAELDEFEGIGLPDERNGEYARIKAVVTLADGSHEEVWIYEWLKGIEGYQVVESGDWLRQV